LAGSCFLQNLPPARGSDPFFHGLLSNKSLQKKSSSEDKAMSDAPAGRHGADDNLLYGMLALQMNFVGRDALLAAMQAWVFDKSKPLGQILQEQGRLTPERRQALDQILAEHLRAHDDDAHQSLRAMSVPDALRDDLSALSDSEVQASLATATDPDATRPGVTMARPGSGRFHVLRPHARGGLGEVFVALDQELHREVALKEIQARFAGDAESRGRFVQEAEITGGLEHPGIVPVYGLGTYADGRPYYAMRLIQGETLREAIRKLHAGEPGMTLRGLLTRFVVVCNAVAYAHSRGVLHRDLKPANVMLGKYGETLVVDWGLAKAMGSEVAGSAREDFDEATLRPRSGDSSTDTQMGSAIGTPGYMSPEQAAGRLNQLGPATDVYGLGATLYTILTGKTPVAVPDSAAVLGQVQHGAWPPPCQVNKRTPAALDAVCRKAMALRPEDRYPTVLALAADVEAWLADEPVAAHVEPWASRALRWMRQRQKLVTAAAAIVVMAALALSVGVVLLTAANERERDLRGAAELKEEEARQQRDEAQRRRVEAWYNLYVANMNLAQREWDNGNLAHVRDLLDLCIPHRPADKDHRGWEWFYQDRLCHGELRILRGHASAVAGVAYNPDESRLATAGKDGTVRVWDTVTGTEVRVLRGHKGEVERVAFSPDGTRLASAGRDRTIRVWEAAGDKELLTIDVDKSAVLGLAYSPDGSRLASASASGIVRLWDAVTGAAVKHFDGHLGDVYSVAYSPDGKYLASAGRDGTVRVWGVADGRELRVLRGHTGRVRSVAYSPDGARLASAGEDGAIYTWNTATGTEVGMRKDRIGPVYGLAYSPEGTRLASVSLDGTVRVWDAVSDQEWHVFRGHTGRINGLAYSADGTRLASAGEDGTARVWDAAGAGEPRLLKGHTGMVQALVYSPDGTQLTSTGQDGMVRIWDTALGRELKSLKVHTSWVNGLAYSPDRTRLATACNDGALRVWDLDKGGPPHIFKGQKKGHEGAVNGVAQSPDGAYLASVGSDGTLRVWDAREGTELKVIKDQPRLLCLAYSPKGRYLAWAGDKGVVHIWDMERGEEVRLLQGHAGSVLHLAYSRDGSRLASSGKDGTVRVWDMVSDRPPRIFRSHTNDVNSSAFSPDGSRLASAGDDGTVRIWDLAGGGEVCVLKNRLGEEADAVAFSPDGTRLAFSSLNGMIQIVDGRPWTPANHVEQEALGLVEGLFGRPLLKAEVLAHLEAHKGITEAVRRQALELCNRFQDEPERFHRASRNVVRYQAAAPALVRKALGWAQTACALAPDSGACLTTLGIAQYRLGQYEEALAILGRAEKLNQTNPSDQPAAIAFQAMAQQRLDHPVEARAALDRLHDLMKKPPHSMHEEALAFLAEAEMLIAP
jgi:WD40 repeat protein